MMVTRRGAMVVAVTLLVMGGATGARAEVDPATVTVPIPDGWESLDQEYRYGPDDLWQYINGAAELFLDYGFRELVVRDLGRGEDAVTVSVYDMGRPLQAYGVYERERPSGGEVLTGVGTAAVAQAPYQALLLKDRFYIKVDAAAGDLTAAAAKEVLSGVAAGLSGDTNLPPELAALPAKNRVEGTVAFTRRDYLGLAELRDCVHAAYVEPGSDAEYELFILAPPDGDAADPFVDLGSRWEREEHGEHRFAVRDIPYRGVVVLMITPTGAVGIAGLEDAAQARTLLVETSP